MIEGAPTDPSLTLIRSASTNDVSIGIVTVPVNLEASISLIFAFVTARSAILGVVIPSSLTSSCITLL